MRTTNIEILDLDQIHFYCDSSLGLCQFSCFALMKISPHGTVVSEFFTHLFPPVDLKLRKGTNELNYTPNYNGLELQEHGNNSTKTGPIRHRSMELRERSE